MTVRIESSFIGKERTQHDNPDDKCVFRNSAPPEPRADGGRPLAALLVRGDAAVLCQPFQLFPHFDLSVPRILTEAVAFAWKNQQTVWDA
jgi:hypothetical protein